jgi:hypothetical protein
MHKIKKGKAANGFKSYFAITELLTHPYIIIKKRELWSFFLYRKWKIKKMGLPVLTGNN